MVNDARLNIPLAVATDRISRLVDVLLPGDDVFPSASKAGTHGVVWHRLRERAGYDQINVLLDRLAVFDNESPEAMIATVQALQDEEPVLFAVVRLVTYTAYYASPVVIDAIRSMGHVYNDAPQPLGYPLRTFDPTPGIDLPLSPHGHYTSTAGVTRIDLAAYPDLALEPTS